MTKIKVQNIKCLGCSTRIKSELEKLGAKNVRIDTKSQEINFEGDQALIEKKLKELGYPRQGTSNTVLVKSKSYLSCLIGKTRVRN